MLRGIATLSDVDGNVFQGICITSIRMEMMVLSSVSPTATANHPLQKKISGRPKRTIQYKRTDDMWTYVASGKRLPGMVIIPLFLPLLFFHSIRHLVLSRHPSLGRVLIVRAVQWNAWLTHTRLNPPSIEVRFRLRRDTVRCC